MFDTESNFIILIRIATVTVGAAYWNCPFHSLLGIGTYLVLWWCGWSHLLSTWRELVWYRKVFWFRDINVLHRCWWSRLASSVIVLFVTMTIVSFTRWLIVLAFFICSFNCSLHGRPWVFFQCGILHGIRSRVYSRLIS